MAADDKITVYMKIDRWTDDRLKMRAVHARVRKTQIIAGILRAAVAEDEPTVTVVDVTGATVTIAKNELARANRSREIELKAKGLTSNAVGEHDPTAREGMAETLRERRSTNPRSWHDGAPNARGRRLVATPLSAIPPPPDAMITVEEAAARLRLAPKTVRAYARAGRVVGAVKVGPQWRFDPATLAILPAVPAGRPTAIGRPAAPTSMRRARPGSGREALQAALARPIKAPPW